MSPEPVDKTTPPRISVVIPVYNDPEGIRATLRSLIAQDYDSYEIIVADNGSSDATPEAAGEFSAVYPLLVKLVFERQKRGPAAARNRGVENARGEIICFMDSDMRADRDFLLKIDAYFKNRDPDYLGYKVELSAGGGGIGSEFHLMVGFPTESFMKNFHYAVTAALAVKRTVFSNIGMFDERFHLSSGEDREFGNRAYRKGCRMEYTGSIRVYHPACGSIVDFYRKYYKYGRGFRHMFSLYPERYGEYRPCNPRFYLPPDPFKIRHNYPAWGEKPAWKKFVFYLFIWGEKLVKVAGYWYELAVEKKNKLPGSRSGE